MDFEDQEDQGFGLNQDNRNVRAKTKNNTNKRNNKREILERAYKKEQRIEQQMYFGGKQDDEEKNNQHQSNEKTIKKLQKQLDYQKDQAQMEPKLKGKAKRSTLI